MLRASGGYFVVDQRTKQTGKWKGIGRKREGIEGKRKYSEAMKTPNTQTQLCRSQH